MKSHTKLGILATAVILAVLVVIARRSLPAQAQRVDILVPLQQQTTITSTDQVLMISESSAIGWRPEVYRNGILLGSTQFGGADDYNMVGCCQIVPSASSGGLVVGDNWQFRFYVWRTVFVY